MSFYNWFPWTELELLLADWQEAIPQVSKCFFFFKNKEYIYSYSKQTVVNSIYEGVIKYTTDISGVMALS